MTAPVCVLCGARDDLAPNVDLDVHWCQDALACADRAAGLTRTQHRPPARRPARHHPRREPHVICTPECWTPVPCPACGRPLPPRGRAVAEKVFLSECCDANRHLPANRRHLWDESEAATWPQ